MQIYILMIIKNIIFDIVAYQYLSHPDFPGTPPLVSVFVTGM